jgi:hypothetical protein
MMRTSELMREIERLPIGRRILLMEKTLRSIRETDHKRKMSAAADLLYTDYREDSELTAFTALDLENFYEAR